MFSYLNIDSKQAFYTYLKMIFSSLCLIKKKKKIPWCFLVNVTIKVLCPITTWTYLGGFGLYFTTQRILPLFYDIIIILLWWPKSRRRHRHDDAAESCRRATISAHTLLYPIAYYVKSYKYYTCYKTFYFY